MSETPIGDQTASDLSTAPPADATPEQQAHDDAVPTDVPDSPDVPDTDDGTVIPVDSPDEVNSSNEVETPDTGEAQFVAATPPSQDEPDPDPVLPTVADDVPRDIPDVPDDAPEVPDYSGTPVDIQVPRLMIDLYRMSADTNARIRRIESLVSDFVSEAKPYLEKIEKGGISAFLGMMFGSKG